MNNYTVHFTASIKISHKTMEEARTQADVILKEMGGTFKLGHISHMESEPAPVEKTENKKA